MNDNACVYSLKTSVLLCEGLVTVVVHCEVNFMFKEIFCLESLLRFRQITVVS